MSRGSLDNQGRLLFVSGEEGVEGRSHIMRYGRSCFTLSARGAMMFADAVGTSPDLTGLATIALAAVTLLSVGVAVAIGRDAARAANASRQAQTFLQIYPWFRSERAHRGRSLLREGDFADLTPEDHQIVQEVYGYYDLLGIFVDDGILNERTTRKMFSGTLQVAVDRLDDWLECHQAGNADLYAMHLKTMVSRWPDTNADAMPDGALLRSYPGRSVRARVRAKCREMRQIITAASVLVKGNCLALGIAIILLAVAIIRADRLGSMLWAVAVVTQAAALIVAIRKQAGRNSRDTSPRGEP
jgi:hypothetical protein